MRKRIVILLVLLASVSVIQALDVPSLEFRPGQCHDTLNWEPYDNNDDITFEYALFRTADRTNLTDDTYLGADANIYQRIGSTETQFIDDSVTHDAVYYYKVVIYWGTKRYGEYATAISGPYTADCKLDADIATFTISAVELTQVTLKWSYSGRVSNISDISDIDHAELYWDTTAGMPNPKLVAGDFPNTVTEKVLSNLLLNKTYFFRLTIIDPVNYKKSSAIISAKTESKGEPVKELAGRSRKSGVIDLSWTYPESAGKVIKNFVLWRSLKSEVFQTGEIIASLDSLKRSYQDQSTPASIPDTLYFYKLMPVTTFGDTIKMGNTEIRVRSDRQAPAKPAFLQEDWGYHKGITNEVSWNAVGSAQDVPVYFIAWYPEGGTYQKQDQISQTTKTFDTQAGKVRFALASIDSLGNTSDTAKSVVINDIQAPKTVVSCHLRDSVYTVKFAVTYTVEDKLAQALAEAGSGVAKSVFKYKVKNLGTNQTFEDSLDSFVSGTDVNVYLVSKQSDSCEFWYGIYSVDKVGNSESFSSYTCGSYKFVNRKAPVTVVQCLKNTIFTRFLTVTYTAKDSLGSEPGKIGIDRSVLKYKIQNLFNPASIIEDSLMPFQSAGILDVWTISNYDSCLVWYGVYSIDKDGDREKFTGYSCGPYTVINKKSPRTEVTCLKDTLYSKILKITYTAKDSLGSQPEKIAVDRTVLKYKIQNLVSPGSVIQDSLMPFASGGNLDVWTRSGFDSCQVWYGVYSIDKDGDIEYFEGYSCGPYKMINTKPVAPVITMPAQNGICKNGTVTIRWNFQPNVDFYEVQQSSDPQFVTDKSSQKMSVLEATFTPLTDNKIYYYRVRSKNIVDTSDFSALRYLLYDNTAPSVVSIQPAGSAIDTVYFRASEFPVFTLTFDDSVDVSAINVSLIDAFNTADNTTYPLIKSPISGMKKQITLSPSAGIPQHSVLKLTLTHLQDCAGNVNTTEYNYLYETYLEYDKGGVVRKHLEGEPLATIDVRAGSVEKDMRLHIHLQEPPPDGTYKLVPDDIEEISFMNGKSVFFFSAKDKDGTRVTQLTQPAEFKLFLDASAQSNQMIYIFKLSKNLKYEANDVWEKSDTIVTGTEDGKTYVKTWITDLTDRYAVVVLDLPQDRLDYAHNFPNPFDPRTVETTFRFSLNQTGSVTIDIYDFFGGKVNSLQANGIAGINEVGWNGRNGQGDVVADGGYMAMIKSAGKTEKIKIAVLKK